MATKFDKIPIKLKELSIPIDRRFIDVLSIMRLNKSYDEVKEQTSALLCDLIGHGERIHPQDVRFIILEAIMPNTKASMLK